jgi:hypothetical protein
LDLEGTQPITAAAAAAADGEVGVEAMSYVGVKFIVCNLVHKLEVESKLHTNVGVTTFRSAEVAEEQWQTPLVRSQVGATGILLVLPMGGHQSIDR